MYYLDEGINTGIGWCVAHKSNWVCVRVNQKPFMGHLYNPRCDLYDIGCM